MVMNAFDATFDAANEVYAVNTVDFRSMKGPGAGGDAGHPGIWIGANVYSPFSITVFLAISIGGILQIIVEAARLIRRAQERAGEPPLTWATFGGAAAGVAVMYLTALLVAA